MCFYLTATQNLTPQKHEVRVDRDSCWQRKYRQVVPTTQSFRGPVSPAVRPPWTSEGIQLFLCSALSLSLRHGAAPTHEIPDRGSDVSADQVVVSTNLAQVLACLLVCLPVELSELFQPLFVFCLQGHIESWNADAHTKSSDCATDTDPGIGGRPVYTQSSNSHILPKQLELREPG